MNYSPKQGVRSHGLPHDPFKSSTVPRPIGWISTVSKDGKDNLAPSVSKLNLGSAYGYVRSKSICSW